MRVVVLVMIMLTLGKLRGDDDARFRWEIASAIVRGTDDERIQEILARLAWYEANCRRSVARCLVKGDKGKSLGLFQIQPMSPHDAGEACGTLDEQVAIGVRYVNRSLAACAHLEPRDRLSVYTAGRCIVGEPAARKRWGSP